MKIENISDPNVSLEQLGEYIKDILRDRPEFKKMKEGFIQAVKENRLSFREYDLAFKFTNNTFGEAAGGSNEVILYSTWYGDPEFSKK